MKGVVTKSSDQVDLSFIIYQSSFCKVLLGEFLQQNIYTLCHTCNTTILKRRVPANAYFNSLHPGSVPIEIARLTDIEIRLISQVRPFMNIVSLKGNFKSN